MTTRQQRMIMAMVFMAAVFTVKIASAEQAQVTVQKTQGKVEARTSAAAAWVAVATGGKLNTGMTVRTGAGSSCTLAWSGGHTMKMQALTIVEISKLDLDGRGKENSLLSLNSGKINSHVNKMKTRDSTFQVKTPTAIAGVRGTDLFVHVAEDNSSVVGVLEGEVFVEAGGQEMLLSQDFIIAVNSTGEMSAPEPMPEEMKQEAEKQKEDFKGTGSQDKGKGDEQGKGISKQEEKSASENKNVPAGGAAPAASATPAATEPFVPAEPAEPEPDIAGVVNDSINTTINETVINEQIVNEALQAAEYKTGGLEVDIYIEP